MTTSGWLQIGLFSLIVLAITRPLGAYMYRVFEGDRQPLASFFGPLEKLLLRLCGTDPQQEHTWGMYSFGLLAFSLLGLLVTYFIQRCQAMLPLNPQGLPAVGPELAFNTAVSFTTNTNWQSYVGEQVMSYLTQMAGLAWHNFTSGAVGICVALAIARGLTRKQASAHRGTVGNFWVDLIRGLLYVLLPISVVATVLLVASGVIQNFSPYVTAKTLDGATQTIAMGPVASQEVIKELGTNGGGFFNANSAHPYENPTAFTDLLEMLLIFVIPAALTYTFGRMAGDQRQGWTIFGAMAALFLFGVFVCYWSESQGNPLLKNLPVDQTAGNMEGKEVRFGVVNSALWATVTTNTSCGAVNAMHDSFTALGGLVPLANMQLGEVVFGGVGAGLYGMLVYVLLSVFIAGLMVGRTPEYLGKKIQAREVQLAMLYILIFPAIILFMAGRSAVYEKVAADFSAEHPAPAAEPGQAPPPAPTPDNLYGGSSLNNSGPHGLSEMLYAYTSGAANNGSAFAGINANTPWYNITLGLVMLAGRFLMIVPALAIAGSMVGKKTVEAGPGTFPTNGLLFTVLLVGVVVIVGALTFFPALCLGPIVEHFIALKGKMLY